MREFGITASKAVRDVMVIALTLNPSKLDQEEIRNTHLRISDVGQLPQHADMLLGADFFLSHRVLISYQQRKIFFTIGSGALNQSNIQRRAGRSAVAAARSARICVPSSRAWSERRRC